MLLPEIKDPVYPLPPGDASLRFLGLYNSYILFSLFLLAFSFFNWCPLWISALQAVSLVFALSLDIDHSWKSRVNLSVLGSQLGCWFDLALRVGMDFGLMWLETFAVFVVFWKAHDFWSWLLPVSLGVGCYLYYITLRTVFLVVALLYPQVHLPSVSTRDLWWSYLLGNSGLVVRCFRYDILKAAGRAVGRHWVPWVVLEPSVGTQVAFVVFLVIYSYRHIGFNSADNYLYYKIHRTMHANHALYAFCHALHHRARFPTFLDSGTISPMELGLTELSIPAISLLWPPFIAVGYECGFAFVGHVIGHSAGSRWGKHHHLHHQYVSWNYGLLDKYDALFGTQHREGVVGESDIDTNDNK